MKKNKTPYFAKRRWACPDCGFLMSEIDLIDMLVTKKCFDCPRCLSHYTENGFNRENYFKWSYEAEIE